VHTADLLLQHKEFLDRREDVFLAIKANNSMGQNCEMACGWI